MANNGKVAKHHMVVTQETYEDLFNLRKPGQTFGDLITELVAERHQKNLMTDLETASQGEFVPLNEAIKQSAGASQ